MIGVRDSKGVTTLENLTSKKRSKTYTFEPGEAPLALVALDRERPNGSPSSVEIVLAANLKSPLVLILPDPEDPAGMRAIAMEDGVDGFPWGSLRFLNTTAEPLVIRCDKETKTIPAKSEALDLAPGGEARNIGVQLLSEADSDVILYSAVWEHDPSLRKLVLITASPDPEVKEPVLEIIPQDKRAQD